MKKIKSFTEYITEAKKLIIVDPKADAEASSKMDIVKMSVKGKEGKIIKKITAIANSGDDDAILDIEKVLPRGANYVKGGIDTKTKTPFFSFSLSGSNKYHYFTFKVTKSGDLELSYGK